MKINMSKIQDLFDKLRYDLVGSLRTELDRVVPVTEPSDIGFLPDGVKYHHNAGASQYFLIQHKPQVRTVEFYGSGEYYDPITSLKKRSYQLSFPHVLYSFDIKYAEKGWHVNDVRMMFASRPVMGWDDVIFHPPLPNMKDFKVCSGQPRISFSTISEAVNDFFQTFWGSHWTAEWCSQFTPSFIETWERKACHEILWDKYCNSETLSNVVHSQMYTTHPTMSIIVKKTRGVINDACCNTISTLYSEIAKNTNGEI